MSKQVRRRRGTTAEHSTFIGAQAEITVDTTKATAVVHDGTTLGGFPLAKEARLINTATGLLGGGDLTADRTISLNVPGLAQDAAVDLSTDYILTYDVAAAEHKRVLYSDFGVQYLWKVCRNESGVTITKGTPVYITGRNGDAITVGVADASDPAKMPAVGVVTANLTNNTNGIVVTSGFVRGVDAGAGVVGDTLYVAPGGGFTTAKPANPNLIQNVGKIVKEGSNGNLLIFGPGRTNDVPALADGHVFIGNSSGVTTQRALTFSDITGSAGNLTATGLTIAENTANESPFTVSGYSLTGSGAQSMFELSGTWNTSGTPTAIKLNVTDTASNAASLLMDLQRGGSSKFIVRKDGIIQFGTPSVYGIDQANGRWDFKYIGVTTGVRLIWDGTIRLGTGGNITWGNAGGADVGVDDLSIVRDGPNILAQRRSTVTQTFRVYNTYTDASNYEAVELSHATYSGGVYSRLRTITAGTGADNINLVLSPSGTGAIMAQVPDGTTAGGNARGIYAVDLQTLRNNANQVASGEGSFVAGNQSRAAGSWSVAMGYTASATTNHGIALSWNATSTAVGGIAIGINTASSGRGAVAIGEGLTAEASYSHATGYLARANKHGQLAHSCGQFQGGNYDLQTSRLIAFRITTDATPAELFLNGSSLRISLNADQRWFASVRIVASTATATAAYAVFERRCLIGRGANAAATAIVGNVQTIGSDIGTSTGSPPAGWAVALSADTTNGALKIEVTGALATTIRWVAEVSLVEVAYA